MKATMDAELIFVEVPLNMGIQPLQSVEKNR